MRSSFATLSSYEALTIGRAHMSNIIRAFLLILAGLAIAIYWSGTYVILFPTAHAPKGGWMTKDLGDCAKSAARYRFGRDITISEGKARTVIGTDARYEMTPKGELHIAFGLKDPSSTRIIPVRVLLDRSADRLTPKGVSVNKGPYKTIGATKDPEQIKLWNVILESYEFKKCRD
jgi:hypothetical protein